MTLGAAKARKLAYRHFMIDDSWLCEGAFLFLLFCFSCYFGADTQMNHMENCAIIANKNVYEPVTCYLLPDASDDFASPASDMNHHKSKSGINVYRNFIIIPSQTRPKPNEKGPLCVNWSDKCA